MSYCAICGDERNLKFYFVKGCQTLCETCAKDTPDKVSQVEFESKYWVTDEGISYLEKVPFSVRKEFYEDYIRSDRTLEGYIQGTIS